MNTRQKFNPRPGPVRGAFCAIGGVFMAGLVFSGEPAPAPAPARGGGQPASVLMSKATNAGRSGDTLIPTTTPATPSSLPHPTPVVPEKKKQARLLGVFGLVVCSILALATGLALLRSLRQR